MIPPAMAPALELLLALVLPTFSSLAESEDFASIDDVVLKMVELDDVKIGVGLGVLKTVVEDRLEVVEEIREVVDERTLVLLAEVADEIADEDGIVGTVSIVTCMKSKKNEAEARACVITKVC